MKKLYCEPFELVYAQIDLKDAVVNLVDGKLGTLIMDSTPADSDVTFTAVSKHNGTKDQPEIEFIDPMAADAALSVVVVGTVITVNLATDAMSVLTTTATLLVAGIVASAPASVLVTAVAEGAGTGLVEAIVKAPLAGGANVLAVKIGEGNLSYSERREMIYTKDRGKLDTVREGDEQTVEVSMDFIWDFLTAVTASGIPTIEDVLKNRGEASAWLTTSSDPCEPFTVDIEIFHTPPCAGIEKEIITLEEYHYETLDHDLREATVASSGQCNKKEATVVRQT